MIICSCNVLSDRDVRRYVKSLGCVPTEARSVYTGLGCAPKCGECMPGVRNLLAELAKTIPPCGETKEAIPPAAAVVRVD